jgi:hypothetical protein
MRLRFRTTRKLSGEPPEPLVEAAAEGGVGVMALASTLVLGLNHVISGPQSTCALESWPCALVSSVQNVVKIAPVRSAARKYRQPEAAVACESKGPQRAES